ncbi:hypothetical protein HK102_010140 [Quaeritorhiza haematococci]|nr:hypothetical protein HK102_010140 [Quaeritorhiza haematococci]
MQLPLIVLIFIFATRISQSFTAYKLAVLWPCNGLFVGYLLKTPSSVRSRSFVLLTMFVSSFAAFCTSAPPFLSGMLALFAVLSVSTSVFITEVLVDRWGGVERTGFDQPNIAIDLQNVRHALLLFLSLLTGSAVTAALVRMCFLPMENTMHGIWLVSEFVGSVLTVPFTLLLDKIPLQFTRERRNRALGVYGVLVALNLLYVGLRFIDAADTQLGIYLAFPWLLLMTHLLGATGAYTGCFFTGLVNAYAAAYFDDIDRIFGLHGYVLVLVATCVGFIEVFRQRDEALSNVENMLMELVNAENRAAAAFESRSQFMVVLCRELPHPLLQIINLANSSRGADADIQVNRLDDIMKRISDTSSYTSDFINEMLELREAAFAYQQGRTCQISVAQAMTSLGVRVASAFVTVDNQLQGGTEDRSLPMSEELFSEMMGRLLAYVRAFVLDRHVTFTVHANDKVCIIQTAHPGNLTKKDDLLEIATPFSTRIDGTSSWIQQSAALGLSLAVVQVIVQQVCGRIHLKSLVSQHRIVILIALPLGGLQLPPGDLVEVDIDLSPPVLSRSRYPSRATFLDGPPAISDVHDQHTSEFRD